MSTDTLARRTYTRWSSADLSTLSLLHERRSSIKEIASSLERTPATVAQYRTKLGLNYASETCRYCEGPVEQNAVGRKKVYCDALCRNTHISEAGKAARREAFGVRHCQHCDEQLVPFQAKYCSRVCGHAAWHQKVMGDPVSRARRIAQLYASRQRRNER